MLLRCCRPPVHPEAPAPKASPGSTALNTTLDNGTTFVASLSNPFPNGVIRPLGAVSGPISGALTDIGDGIGDSFFIDYVNPVVQQWNFNIQQQVKGNWVIQVGYLGSKGQHLPDGESSMNYDQLPDSFLALGSGLDCERSESVLRDYQESHVHLCQSHIQARLLLDAYPQYSGVNAFRKPQANSNYQSFILSAEHRYHNGFTMLVSFTGEQTYGRRFAGSYLYWPGRQQAGLLLPVKCEKSVSAQDVPKRLVTSATYELPVGKNRHYFGSMPKAADFVLGGWQINGIMTFQKGIPIAISNGGNSANLGAPGLRPTDNGQNPAEFRLDRRPPEQLLHPVGFLSDSELHVRQCGPLPAQCSAAWDSQPRLLLVQELQTR